MPLTKIKSLGITDGTIVNDDISASAGITSAKLDDLANPFGKELLHVRDEKASTTEGGASVGTTTHTRVLNTVKTNEISGASLASNQITLPSGTYFIISRSPAFMTLQHKSFLYNITDSANAVIGSACYCDSGGTVANDSIIFGRFTIAAQKVFEIRHYVTASRSNNGLGVATSLAGAVEVYTDTMIWKVA